jgi:hypothetical protein
MGSPRSKRHIDRLEQRLFTERFDQALHGAGFVWPLDAAEDRDYRRNDE